MSKLFIGIFVVGSILSGHYTFADNAPSRRRFVCAISFNVDYVGYRPEIQVGIPYQLVLDKEINFLETENFKFTYEHPALKGKPISQLSLEVTAEPSFDSIELTVFVDGQKKSLIKGKGSLEFKSWADFIESELDGSKSIFSRIVLCYFDN